MHHVVDQNALLVLKFSTHKKFHNHEEKILTNSFIYVYFKIKKLPRLNITSDKALVVKKDILDMSRKKQIQC